MHKGTLLNPNTNCLHWTYIVIVPIVINDVTHIHTHVPITIGNRNGNITSDAHRATYPRPRWSPRICGTAHKKCLETESPQTCAALLGNKLQKLPEKLLCCNFTSYTKITSNVTRHLSIFYSALRSSLTFPNRHFITKVYRKVM
jgi:hypothetical protein